MRHHKLFIGTETGTKPTINKFGILHTERRDPLETYPFHTTAKLRYNPKLKGKYNDWWLIADCDQGIVDYYRKTLERIYGFELLKPAFGSHVSIIVGEEPTNKDLWLRDQGREISLSYTHEVYTNGEFWWLNVYSPEMEQIRKDFGFEPKSTTFHITVGRFKKEDMNKHE